MAIGGFGGTIGANLVGKWLATIGYEASFRNCAILTFIVMLIIALLIQKPRNE